MICRYTPDLCSYTTMLSAYVNASDMEGAENFFKRIKRDGFEPNVVTYGTLIKGYSKENDIEKMMEKYEEMCLCGLKANTTILTTIMDAHGRNHGFDSAVIWFNEMGSNGIIPDQKAKNILLSLAKSAEEKAEADLLVGCTNGHDANVMIPSAGDNDHDDTDAAYDDDSEQTIQFTPEDELILADS